MSRPSQDQLEARVEFLAGDAPEADDKPKRFSLVAYTGAIVRRYYGNAIFDLTGMEAPKKLAILLEHRSSEVVGHADQIEIGDVVRMSGDVYEDEEAGETVRRRSLKGFPWKASIGVEVMRWQELDQGKTAEVNGQTVTGPISIARESRLFETSFVVNPADSGTSGEAMTRQEGDVDAKTVSTLTTEQVTEQLAAAKTEGSKATRTELGEFLAKFPGREGWAALKFAEGLSEVETKAELADVLQEELTAAKTSQTAATTHTKIVTELAGQAGVSFDASARQAGTTPTEAEQLAALPEAEQADRMWDSSESLRKEFAGRKAAFLTIVRRDGLASFRQEA